MNIDIKRVKISVTVLSNHEKTILNPCLVACNDGCGGKAGR